MVRHTQPPTVSILMPTHNRGDVITHAIESVLAQTVGDFELLIACDGCTDETEAIVAAYAARDARVRWFQFPKGPGFGYEHRNTVLKNAAGIYVAFAAHDDLWLSDHLEVLLDFFERNPSSHVAYTRPLWIHPDGTIVPSSFDTNIPEHLKLFLSHQSQIPAGCVMHTREAMEAVGYVNASLPEAADWDLWKRIVAYDPHHRIGHIPTPTMIHFRANWRTDDNSWGWPLAANYHLLSVSCDCCERLRVRPSRDRALQQVVWESLSPRWIENLRQEVVAWLDYSALGSLHAELFARKVKHGLARVSAYFSR